MLHTTKMNQIILWFYQFQIKFSLKSVCKYKSISTFHQTDVKLPLTRPLYCMLIDFLLSMLFTKCTLFKLIALSRLLVAHDCLKPVSELDHRGRASFNPPGWQTPLSLYQDSSYFKYTIKPNGNLIYQIYLSMCFQAERKRNSTIYIITYTLLESQVFSNSKTSSFASQERYANCSH